MTSDSTGIGGKRWKARQGALRTCPYKFLALALWLAAVVASPALAVSAEAVPITIIFVDRAGDPFYAPRESYGGIYDATRKPAVQGAELGIRDVRIIGRAIGASFELRRATAGENEDIAVFVHQLMEREKPRALILDLPEGDTIAVARASGRDLAKFNIRNRSLDVRQATCATSLFHVIPSDAMFSDALAQYLKFMGWEQILVLTSDSAADIVQSDTFQASARKFGITVTDVRTYVHGNDPRQRDQNNVKLLTGGAYDAIFIADETRDFARLLPYRTMSPRPVVGAAGLFTLAWHPQWERNGAPQLNRRFFKLAGRTMTEEDWAAWIAVRTVAEATVRGGTDAPLSDLLLKPDLTLELYKGFPGSFRTWDRQLRQAILLATTDTVIALAPVEGALHQFNTLDTLGLDEPEFTCPG